MRPLTNTARYLSAEITHAASGLGKKVEVTVFIETNNSSVAFGERKSINSENGVVKSVEWRRLVHCSPELFGEKLAEYLRHRCEEFSAQCDSALARLEAVDQQIDFISEHSVAHAGCTFTSARTNG